MTTLKTITYRGGVARFQIPATWREEYEPTGGGTFYEDVPDSGTLRINVMDFERPPAQDAPSTAQDVLTRLGGGRKVASLSNGMAIARLTQAAVEQGHQILLYRWEIAVPVSPSHVRLIIFTHTILAAQQHDPAMQAELQLLDRCFTEGEYPALSGEVGDYHHTNE